jgi:thiamine biosynthesis lipoprotein
VRIDPAEIRLDPGMALTLNGIAQGYIADRVATLLRGMGLERILVNTGEFAALGGDPRGGPWQIGLRAGDGVLPDRVPLEGGALASSAALGITFDAAGQAGHILDPRSGRPAPGRWRLVSVTAPQAALADALSTAFCLLDRARIDAALAAFPQARIAALVPAA